MAAALLPSFFGTSWAEGRSLPALETIPPPLRDMRFSASGGCAGLPPAGTLSCCNAALRIRNSPGHAAARRPETDDKRTVRTPAARPSPCAPAPDSFASDGTGLGSTSARPRLPPSVGVGACDAAAGPSKDSRSLSPCCSARCHRDSEAATAAAGACTAPGGAASSLTGSTLSRRLRTCSCMSTYPMSKLPACLQPFKP